MNAQELLDEWTSGEQSGMRAHRIKAVREDLMEATGEYIPKRPAEIDALILSSPQRIGVITRKLREATDPSEGSDADNDKGEQNDGEDN